MNRTLPTPPRDFEAPFVTGDKLDRETFHRLYLDTPNHFRAELIDGVVDVASPVSFEHSDQHYFVGAWISMYGFRTPGVRGLHNASIIGDGDDETQPDMGLYVMPEAGGRMTRTEDGYLRGPAELLVEISKSSRQLDLNAKKDYYERLGVSEYLVVDIPDEQIHWFHLVRKSYRELIPEDGIWKSKVFPGLWMTLPCLFPGSESEIEETMKQGLSSAEHTAFVAKLAKKAKGKKRG
ncbi:MAG: Uma2 family endonuclease [Fimbriiglobus sp.]